MSGNPSNRKLRIVFVTTMTGAAWGGSEELWHGTAKRMRNKGHDVGISVFRWPETPRQVSELESLGCDVEFRPLKKSIPSKVVEKILRRDKEKGIPEASLKWLKRKAPDLVVISQGFPLEGVSWMLACRKLGIKYAGIIQAASEIWWPPDNLLKGLCEAYAAAAGLYFVSRSNRELLDVQCGMKLENASVVSNPWNVEVNDVVPWPADSSILQLACVGRMDPRAKGQDVLLGVLAMDKWRNRPVHLNFYGSGPSVGSIKRMVEMWGLESKVSFKGQVADVSRIWAENHALVLPSRFEGLPLVIVEAMLCGRPVITSDVAGNAEYLTEGVNGFIAAAPTRPLLDDAMERAWSARAEWKDMGTHAREDVLSFLPKDPYQAFESKLLEIA